MVTVTSFLDTFTQEILHFTHPLSLPVLTTLDIDLGKGDSPPCLTSILRSISSAPALGSITLGNNGRFNIGHSFQDLWGDMDRWLARVAEHTKAQGRLSVILKRWPNGESVSEGFLRDFRRAGGQVKTEVCSW